MFVLGVKAGNMARQASDDLARALQTRGYQVEAGLKAWLGEGMEGSGILKRGGCRGQTEGSDEQRGCFGESDNKKSTISRFALQIAYRTGGSL